MATMFVHHKVKDYASWRPVFDDHEASRVGAGITNGRVYQKADDPNDIVILLDVADVAKAKMWGAGHDLRSAMERSGVIGAPIVQFWD